MTAIYSIPSRISERHNFRSKPVNASAIKAVIPTYNDWDGMRITVESLLNLKTPPAKIAVANDNPDPAPAWLADYEVEVIEYPGNLGPAQARNRGFGLREGFPPKGGLSAIYEAIVLKRGLPDYARNGWAPELRFNDTFAVPTEFRWESDIDWYYFTDCGCTHHPDLFLEFEKAWRDCGDCCVAISGAVTGSGHGPINHYMTEQGILNPPLEKTVHGVYLPQAIVTANALIAALPFAYLGGFDPAFQEAAGEDLDMGIRLRELGVIMWAPAATAAHAFEESEPDFYKRFRRYGRGNRKLEMKHGLPCLRARPFTAEKPELQRLADLSLEAMQAGYDEAVDESVRGVLKVLPD